MLNWSRNSIPPTAASDPPSANVIEIVRFTLIPIIAEASRSWAVARIAFPCLVDLTIQVRMSSTGMVTRMTVSLFQAIDTSPIENADDDGMSAGALR